MKGIQVNYIFQQSKKNHFVDNMFSSLTKQPQFQQLEQKRGRSSLKLATLQVESGHFHITKYPQNLKWIILEHSSILDKRDHKLKCLIHVSEPYHLSDFYAINL